MEKTKRYAIAAPTSMGVRITPTERRPAHTGGMFYMHATSAESNALNVASSLGCECLVLTKFVENSPISRLIKDELRARNIFCEGASVPQGDPWGFRHQFNIADSGYGVRGPRVHNDRAGEVGKTLSANEFDLESIFGRQGVEILHLSGLIAALSPETSEFCLEVVKAARKYGSKISFDLNYRASFWKGYEEPLRRTFGQIASLADILIGNEEDYQLALGINGPEAGGGALSEKLGGFKGMIERVQSEYPNVTLFANTLRQVVSANEHLWGSIVYSNGEWHVEEPRSICVLDRIGGGDGFSGGLLYGVLKGWTPEKCMKFGWAAGALAVTSLNDYASPIDEDEVWDIYKGNARVKR